MSDIASIKVTERFVEMVHPATKELLGIRVSLMSLDDDRMKKIKRTIQDRRLYLEARGKHFKAEELEENRDTITFGAMTGWHWYNPTGVEGDQGYDASRMPSFRGKVPEFTRANVRAVFEELPWFREHLDEEIGETKAFFAVSEAN